MARMHAVRAAEALRPRLSVPWWVEMWGRLLREKPLGSFGGFLVLVLVLSALFAEVISPARYDEVELLSRMQPPNAQHWMGTDNLGRDLLSRIIYGARISMYVGL